MPAFYSKFYRMLIDNSLQHFVFGIAICSIFYPFGAVVAVVATLMTAYLKAKYENRNVDLPCRDIVATVSGASFLLGWYALIESLQNYMSGIGIY